MTNVAIGPAFLQVSRQDGWRSDLTSPVAAEERAEHVPTDEQICVNADVSLAAMITACSFVGGAIILGVVALANLIA